jgi:hypothetical protein
VPHGAGAYTFRHIVIREVAYATLPRAERVRAHLRLASWLEQETPARANELAELVAYQYRQAIALSPGGRVPEGLPVATVVAALERAARVASNVGAFREAGEMLREAVRLAPPEDHLRLLELRGDLLLFGDLAATGYAEGYESWLQTRNGDPRIGARLLVKQLAVHGRWAGSLVRVMERAEFGSFVVAAQQLLERAPDETLEAKLACARAFHVVRYTDVDRSLIVEIEQGTRRAAAFFAASGDLEAESEALDALAAVYRSGYNDAARALEVTERRAAKAARLSLLERIDICSVRIWDLVFVGRYDEAVDTHGESRESLRPGEPEHMLAHSAAWAAYAAMLCGRWDDAVALGDLLLAMREEVPELVVRFTYPGWIGAMRVAAARLDTTRLARLRSAFKAIANADALTEPMRSMWTAFIDRDGDAARRVVLAPLGTPDRKGELIAFTLFDLGQAIGEAELAPVDRASSNHPPVLALRMQLARAMNGDAGALRSAIAALDAGHLVADAARAAALLALRTKDAADRADAERRLTALGDRAYLQRLAEDW